MNATVARSSATADREIATTRLLDAPRDLVFDGWTDPQHIGQWPLEMLNIVTFTEHGDKTMITLRCSAYAATEEERATFKAGRGSMQGGFTGTFDQLDAYLAKARS